MILKHIKKVLTLQNLTNNHTLKKNTFFLRYKFSQASTQSSPPPATYIQQYRNILLKLNVPTLRNEMVHMKKCTKKVTQKLKKMEMIDELCGMGQEMITTRLGQLSNTTILQLDSRAIYQLGSSGNGDATANKLEMNPQQTQQQAHQQSIPSYEQNRSSANILKNSLRKLLTPDINRVLYTEQVCNEHIMDALYDNWVQKNKQLKEKLQIIKLNEKAQKNNEYPKQHDEKPQPNLLQSIENIKVKKKLRKTPFINRLFKTNQQLTIEQKKRKYLYEIDKSDIINQIFDDRPSNIKEYIKTMEQITLEKKESKLMKGFTARYSHSAYKLYYKNKQRVLRTFCGFFYYKQLLNTPHLIQFIFALTFDRDLPLEITILKIVEEYLQCPQTFKSNLKAIQKEHYLKFLRASSNYILKLFKKIDTQTQNNKEDAGGNQMMMGKNGQNNWQNTEDEQTSQTDDYADDDMQIREKQKKLSKKLGEQTQKFPKSKQYIDLQLIRFALAIFQAGVQRVTHELSYNKQFFLDRGQFSQLQLSQYQHRQLKSTHETLMLSFDMYKTIQSLFASIDINDFSDLEKLSHVLLHYSNIRQHLKSTISALHKFMLNYDRHFEEKLQLGLGNIPTEKQLEIDNFILKHQARKLNFDLIDNITSMLKHDNLQITLENKRQQIFAVLERIFQVYIQNEMIDFLEEQLIYNIMRFLEKEVYLDNKVKALFDARVNFDRMMAVKEKERNAMREGRKQDVSEKVKSQQQAARKQSMMQSLAMNASNQYDFSNPNSQPQLATSQQKPTTPSPQFQWFQLQSIYSSQQQPPNTNQYNFNQLVFQKSQKSQYFMGRISQLMSRQLLSSLIKIIKYKHDRKEIEIEQINGFNLIQEWYSEPSVVRLQFLKEEIIQRYKRICQYNKV